MRGQTDDDDAVIIFTALLRRGHGTQYVLDEHVYKKIRTCVTYIYYITCDTKNADVAKLFSTEIIISVDNNTYKES